MSGRLLSMPVGLPVTGWDPLTGPRSIGASQSETMAGYSQTTGSPFGLWRFQFSFAEMLDDNARRFRGWVAALHAGANATRWSFFDMDRMRPEQMGLALSAQQKRNGMPWAQGLPWFGEQDFAPLFETNWAATPPLVVVSSAAARNATVIELAPQFWGHRLDEGDYLGFMHFGLYMVTEVFEPGRYRIWPPLRRAISLGEYSTLDPVLVLKLPNESAAKMGRGLSSMSGVTLVLEEVLDSDVRNYFAE